MTKDVRRKIKGVKNLSLAVRDVPSCLTEGEVTAEEDTAEDNPAKNDTGINPVYANTPDWQDGFGVENIFFKTGILEERDDSMFREDEPCFGTDMPKEPDDVVFEEPSVSEADSTGEVFMIEKLTEPRLRRDGGYRFTCFKDESSFDDIDKIVWGRMSEEKKKRKNQTARMRSYETVRYR